jgi:hypothetical protein
MLLDNLVSGESGAQIHAHLGSTLEQGDCILRLFLLSVGAFFFSLTPMKFNKTTVREATHPFFLARMNVVMYDLNGWCELRRPELGNWGTPDKFQEIMGYVQQAVDNDDFASAWSQQSDFLKSSEGKQYLDDLYAAQRRLREQMSTRKWELLPASKAK